MSNHHPQPNHPFALLSALSIIITCAATPALVAPQPSTSASQSTNLPIYQFPDPNPPTIVVPQPPVAARIRIEPPDAEGNAVVAGAAGAVQPGTVVVVACLDTGAYDMVQANADGSFQARLFAPPGTFVQVKHFFPPGPIEELKEMWKREPKPGLGQVNPTAGTILFVPASNEAPGPGQPFAVAGVVWPERGDGQWTFVGTMELEGQAGQDRLLKVSGTLRVTSPVLQPGTYLPDAPVVAHLNLHRLFDQQGQQVPIGNVFVNDYTTPTGLPVTRSPVDWTPIGQSMPVTEWRRAGDHDLEAHVSMLLPIPRETPPGHYRPWVFFWLSDEFPLGPRPHILDPRGEGRYLPILRLGGPAPARLTWTLLTDTLYDGTRGTVAREDKAHFGLVPFTTLPADTFVVPRDDARTGQPIAYRLEPFLPLVAYTDRGLPNPPLVPFKFPSGSLTVTVRRPDGTVDTLGPAIFQQSTSRSPAYPWGKMLDNDGGSLHDVYQLTTLDDAFAYTFQQYGHHVITMTGTVEDVWGNVYQGGGTYDVTVARPLKLYTGPLPTTPFEVGDAFAPTVQVYPRVPADVELQFQLLPDSDPGQAITYTIQGQANDFGYFGSQSHKSESQIPITQPGEYRVDVTAVYTEPTGILWAGSATWGSVVETPDSPLVAHGRRGIDALAPNGQAWFFHQQLGRNFIGHTYYPYYAGDVFWSSEAENMLDIGGDAFISAMSIQDTVGDVYGIMRERWETHVHSEMMPPEQFQDRMSTSELPLFSTTSDGSDLLWSPDRVDQVGYAYRSSQRPDARVHETISEDQLGIAYWRFNATYGGQVGVEGDLPNDLKWNFGGTVFRYLPENLNLYAAYASLWVMIPGDDALGPRVTPPFQGAAGGVDGGPILTLKGQDVDIFFLPRSGGPGQVLEVGDTFALAGHVGPPLDARLSVTVTAPSGLVRTIEGQANKVGYFYQPEDDFAVDEAGVWTVDVRVTHEGMTSAGPVQPPYPTGDVLGSDRGRYCFYVVPHQAAPIELDAPTPGFLPVSGATIPPVRIVGRVPPGARGTNVHYTIAMPGYILEQGTVTPSGETFTIVYDPVRLHQDYPNLDLTAFDFPRPGLADQVWISFLLSDDAGNHYARSVTLRGEEVLIR